MTRTEMEEGILRNNMRAQDPGGWRLRWISQTIVPTSSVVTARFAIPESAAEYRLGYVLIWWPVGPGAFRPIFVQVDDDRGIVHVLKDKAPEVRNGAKVSLFTGPGTDPNSALAGDQSAYKSMMPLGLRFPGRATLTVMIRGILGTPDPEEISVLLAGHQRNKYQ